MLKSTNLFAIFSVEIELHGDKNESKKETFEEIFFIQS